MLTRMEAKISITKPAFSFHHNIMRATKMCLNKMPVTRSAVTSILNKLRPFFPSTCSSFFQCSYDPAPHYLYLSSNLFFLPPVDVPLYAVSWMADWLFSPMTHFHLRLAVAPHIMLFSRLCIPLCSSFSGFRSDIVLLGISLISPV